MGAAPLQIDLLCERCGYRLDELDPGERCPECGDPIAESLPDRRAGSPWQRRRGPRPWLATCAAMLRRPGRTLRRVAIASERTRGLLAINLLIAGGLLWLPCARLLGWLIEAKRHLLGLPEIQLSPFVAALIFWPATSLALLMLTRLEARGLRFFGARHGFRLTPESTSVICAHASVGWIVAGMLSLGGAILGELANGYALTHRLGDWRGAFMLAPGWMPLAGLFAGMIVFEFLAWLGMRRCRFANPPRPDSPPSEADPAGRTEAATT